MNQRIRSIKPEIWQDEKVRLMSDAAQLLLVRLMTFADDEGRFRAEVGGIAAFAAPARLEADPVGCIGGIKAALDEAARSRVIVLYEVDSCKYGAFVHWRRHQKIDKPTPSRFPAPPREEVASPSGAPREEVASPSGAPREEVASPSGAPREEVAPGSRIMDQGSGITDPGAHTACAGAREPRRATPAQMASAEPIATAGQPVESTPLSRVCDAFLAIQERRRLQLSPQETNALQEMLEQKPEAEVIAAINQVPLKYERRTVEQVRWALFPREGPARPSHTGRKPLPVGSYAEQLKDCPQDDDLMESANGT